MFCAERDDMGLMKNSGAARNSSEYYTVEGL